MGKMNQIRIDKMFKKLKGTKILYLIFEDQEWNDQFLMGVYSTQDKAIHAFEKYAGEQLKEHMPWIDKNGYFCSSQGEHNRFVINNALYYIQEQVLDNKIGEDG